MRSVSPVTLSLPPGLVRDLDAAASKAQRSRSALAVILLADALRHSTPKRSPSPNPKPAAPSREVPHGL